LIVATFVPGQELGRAFYGEVVRPLLGATPHGAALLGWGSDVLGYDTQRSVDHGWGPRLLIFVDDDAVLATREAVDASLPEMFRGWPVRFGWDEVPVSSHVTVTALRPWLLDQLGVDALSALSTRDWLLTPQQRILGVVAGAIYADDSGQLTGVRRRLAWYPDDVWRWLVACQWRRIEQEEAFVQRTAEVGDDLGSHVVAGRLVRDMMRMALLLDRRYAPYSKWLGTAFAAVQHDDGLASQLSAILSAGGTSEREEALAVALTTLARRHNEARISDEVDPTTRPFHSRPAQVLLAHRLVDACLAGVNDPMLRRLPLIGSIDQFVDSTDVLSDPMLSRRLAVIYE
jgi:Domain of unknown function (DUF4037)